MLLSSICVHGRPHDRPGRRVTARDGLSCAGLSCEYLRAWQAGCGIILRLWLWSRLRGWTCWAGSAAAGACDVAAAGGGCAAQPPGLSPPGWRGSHMALTCRGRTAGTARSRVQLMALQREPWHCGTVAPWHRSRSLCGGRVRVERRRSSVLDGAAAVSRPSLSPLLHVPCSPLIGHCLQRGSVMPRPCLVW